MAAGLIPICNSDLPAREGDAACLRSEAAQHPASCCAPVAAGTPVHGTYCKHPSVAAAEVVFQVPDSVSHIAEAVIFSFGSCMPVSSEQVAPLRLQSSLLQAGVLQNAVVLAQIQHGGRSDPTGFILFLLFWWGFFSFLLLPASCAFALSLLNLHPGCTVAKSFIC